MTADTLFPPEAEDTRVEILRATYEGMCEYGYSDLTIERIGEHFPKSTSLIYHHYDGKDELLLDFLSYLLDRFENELVLDYEGDANDRLAGLLDHVLPLDSNNAEDAFHEAVIELRAQAASDDAYRQHIDEHDDLFLNGITTIIEDGIETGVFRDVDATAVGTTIQTVLTGAMVQQATTETFDPTPVRTELDRYIENHLLATGR